MMTLASAKPLLELLSSLDLRVVAFGSAATEGKLRTILPPSGESAGTPEC
jgi:hypothetical protein